MSDPILDDRDFNQIRDLVYRHAGISLSDAKRQLVKSRLQKRLRHFKLESYGEYCKLVKEQGESGPELLELINCITTNKTDFYRERHHFDFIAQQVVPEWVRAAARGERSRRIRVWHAGCSTGEEPYTLAITLKEALSANGSWDIRQLASDIDTNVLAHAENGVYDEDRVAPVPAEMLRRHFLRSRTDDGFRYKVRPEVRDMVTFRRINLLDDPWPIKAGARFDLLFCRNVIIYFDKPTQRRLFARYRNYMNPGGYLFIGHSESLFGVSDDFRAVGNTIYQFGEEVRRAA